jgi:hypothetical protein
MYYELLLEVAAWRTGPTDVMRWAREYGTRRYAVGRGGAAVLNGTMDAIRSAFYESCLDIGCGHGKGLPSMMQRVPRLYTGVSPCLGMTRACNLYDARAGLIALQQLLTLAPHVGASGWAGYSYDLVDVAHQALQWLFADAVRAYLVEAALTNRSSGAVQQSALRLGSTPGDLVTLGDWIVELVELADSLLRTDRNYLLGTWVSAARAKAATCEEEADHFEHNARELISVSFPGDNDYGARSWSPTYSQYYAPRWRLFVNATATAVAQSVPFDTATYTTAWRSLGDTWARSHSSAPTEPEGDILTRAKALLDALSAPLAQRFERHASTDVAGRGSTFLTSLMTTDVRAMATICMRWARCAGFASDGRLFSSLPPASRVPRAGGCGGRSAYRLIKGHDLCTADTCNDFAPTDKQVNRFPQGRNLKLVRPATRRQLEEACEATPRCSGFSVASWGNVTAMGGWLKGGTIRVAGDESLLNSSMAGQAGLVGELTALQDANLYHRIGGAVTTSCDLYLKRTPSAPA